MALRVKIVDVVLVEREVLLPLVCLACGMAITGEEAGKIEVTASLLETAASSAVIFENGDLALTGTIDQDVEPTSHVTAVRCPHCEDPLVKGRLVRMSTASGVAVDDGAYSY